MSKPLPTWEALAKQRGVNWCRGLQKNGQRCYHANHTKGEALPEPGQMDLTMHWKDRQVSRTGIRKFLFAIAYGEAAAARSRWLRHYIALRAAIVYTQQAGLRLPASMWELDKVRLKSMLLTVPTTDPEREEAMDWVLK